MLLKGLDEWAWEPGAALPKNRRCVSAHRQHLQVGDVLQLAHDTARGVAHIHDCGYVHFDLACRNVFCTATLDAEGRLQRQEDGRLLGLRACVADFGRTLPLPANGQPGRVTQRSQPLRDCAPEASKARPPQRSPVDSLSSASSHVRCYRSGGVNVCLHSPALPHCLLLLAARPIQMCTCMRHPCRMS